MFSLVSGVYDAYLAPAQLNLLVVGAEGVGKTALLERLKVTQFTKHVTAARPVQKRLGEDRVHQLPELFLPLELRIKQQEFHDSFRSSTTNTAAAAAGHYYDSETQQQQQQQPNNKAKQTKQKKTKPAVVVQQQQEPKRRSFLSCPAPSKYTQAAQVEDDSSSSSSSSSSLEGDESPNGLPLTSEVSQDLSLEDVNLNTSLRLSQTNNNNNNNNNGHEDEEEEEEDQQQQHDLKDKTKPMLPLHKIRPTSAYYP